MRWSGVAVCGLFFAGITSLGCAPGAPASADQSRSPEPVVVAALDAANEAFSAAWLAGDVDGILAAYTDDAVLHPPAGGVLTTADARRGLWASIGESDRVGHRIEPTLRHSLGEGLVLEMGRWHSSIRTDGESPWLSGCYSVVWRQDAGQWRMKYDGWTAPNEASWACRPR